MIHHLKKDKNENRSPERKKQDINDPTSAKPNTAPTSSIETNSATKPKLAPVVGEDKSKSKPGSSSPPPISYSPQALPSQTTKNIALIFVPWAGVLTHQVDALCDYINSVVIGSLLRYSRSFDQIKVCTVNPINDVFEFYFAGNDFQFQFRNNFYKCPMKDILNDELVKDSINRAEKKKAEPKSEKKKSFFLNILKTLQTDKETNLFLFLLDHGEVDSIGRISYSAIIKAIDQMTLGHVIVVSDARMSGVLTEYIQLSSYLHRSTYTPLVLISSGKMQIFSQVTSLKMPLLLEFLDLLNVDGFINHIFDMRKKQIEVSAALLYNLSSVKTITELKRVLFYDELIQYSKTKGYELFLAIDDIFKIKQLSSQDIAKRKSVLKDVLLSGVKTVELFLSTIDFLLDSGIDVIKESYCIPLREIYNFVHKYIDSWKYKQGRCTKEVTINFLKKYQDVYSKNYSKDLIEAMSFGNSSDAAYTLLEKYVPSKDFKITVISSTTSKLSDNYADPKRIRKKNIYLGSPGTVEFLAAVCLEDGKLRSIFDKYKSEIKSLDIIVEEGGQQIPTMFSTDPWFESTDVSSAFPYVNQPINDPNISYEDRFVDLLKRVGFVLSDQKGVEGILGKHSSSSSCSQTESSSETSLMDFDEYILNHPYEEEEDNHSPEAGDEYIPIFHKRKIGFKMTYKDRGLFIVREFARYFNFILKKKGMPEFSPVYVEHTPEQQEKYEEYLNQEELVFAEVLELPAFWNIRESLAVYIDKNSTEEFNAFDVFEEACYSFTPIINKYYKEQYQDSITVSIKHYPIRE